MPDGDCPRLDCVDNYQGSCHHALQPNPDDCAYYRPRKRSRRRPRQARRFGVFGGDGCLIDALVHRSMAIGLSAAAPSCGET